MANTNTALELQQEAAAQADAEGQLPLGLQEFGTTGLWRAGGQVFEEYLTDLRGTNGIKRYIEMSENDPIAGGMMFAINRILERLPWEISPNPNGKTDPASLDLIRTAFEDMETPWSQVMQDILSMTTFGWAFLEQNYKIRGGPDETFAYRRSDYSDGLIGWKSFRIRAQDTLIQWEYADNGDLLGMTQQDPNGGGTKTIPIGKALLFRTNTYKDNPEGRSLLRGAYRPWYYKKRLEDFEAIGVERDLAGLPVATLPPEYFAPNASPAHVATRNLMAKLVQDIRNDASGGVLLPTAYDDKGNKLITLELMASPGQKAFDTNAIITRKNNEMAMSILMDFMMLGHSDTGSFALGTAKIDLWTMAVEAVARSIAQTFNTFAIKKLLRYNSMDQTNAPELTFGEISNVDLTELGDFLQKAIAAGALVPDGKLEEYLRDVAHLPPREPDLAQQ
jgi:hypothetical protein